MKRFWGKLSCSFGAPRSIATTRLLYVSRGSRLYSKDSSVHNSVPNSVKNEVEAVKKVLQSAQPSETPKLLIGFTCKSCSTRTHRLMSRQAYEKGIVLIECPGCETRHLIADNLGWFKDTPQAARRIEEMPEVGAIRRELNLSESEASELLDFIKDEPKDVVK